MLRNRAAGLLIAVFFCTFGTWMMVSDALGQARDARRSAASRVPGLAAWEQVYAVRPSARINCDTGTAYHVNGARREVTVDPSTPLLWGLVTT